MGRKGRLQPSLLPLTLPNEEPKSSVLRFFSESLHPLHAYKHQPSSPPSTGEAPSCCHERALMEIKQPFTVRRPIA